MNNEKRIVACKVTKNMKNPESKDFFTSAEGNSREFPGESVQVKIHTVGDGLIGYVYRDNENDHIAIIRGDSQTEELDEKYGQFASMSTIKEITENRYDARVIGRKTGSYAVIEIEELGEATKEIITEEAISEIEKTLEGVLSEEGFKKRKALLETYEIDEKSELYKKVLENIKKQDVEIEAPKTIYKKLGKQNVIKRILSHIVCGHNVILEGPKSVGKNVAWETVAYILNCKIIMLQCDGKMTKSSMFGHASTDNSLKDKITSDGAKALLDSFYNKTSTSEANEFLKDVAKSMSPTLKLSPGPVTQALLEANEGKGVILLLDEMNLSDPNTLSGAFNALTDRHTKSIYINDLGDVPIPEGLIIGATQNCLGGNYLGTKQQNDATLSRFVCLDIKEAGSIKNILKQVDVNVDPEALNILDKIYHDFTNLVLSGVSESCLNVRGFKAALESVALGMSVADAVGDCVINTVPVVDDRDTLRSVVDDHIV